MMMIKLLCLTASAAAFAPARPPVFMRRALSPRMASDAASASKELVPLSPTRVVNFFRGKASSERITCGELGTDECIVLCDSLDECALVGRADLLRRAKLGLYFSAWFALSAYYNIANKRVLNAVALPWIHSTATLGVGAIYVLFLWTTKLRKAPRLSNAALKPLLPIAACHAIGHASAVLSFSAGAVSFTQIVKAAEPVFTCGLSLLFLKQAVSLPVALSLIPIVLGVAIASVTELSFTWLAFGAAMASNVAFATRNIFARRSLDAPKGENMTPENLFGVLTLLAFAFSVPVALAIEGPKIGAAIAAATMSPRALTAAVFKTGAYFYLYNEVRGTLVPTQPLVLTAI